MSRSLVYANGRLHVGIDTHGLVHELYYPYVGLENHLGPTCLPHKIGVFLPDSAAVSWLDDGSWSIRQRYHQKTMVGDVVATNEALGLRVEMTDCVDSELDVFLRTIHVVNMTAHRRDVILYCHQAFMIGESFASDSVQYRPDKPGVMHYKGKRVFLATLQTVDGSFDSFSVGTYDAANGNGTYRDAEDGVLAGNMVENGHTDSVMGLSLSLEPAGSARALYWLVAAESVAAAEHTFDTVLSVGPLHYVARTGTHWHDWLAQAAVAPTLPARYRKAFDQSLLVIKAHGDARGAIMASLDGSLRDHPQNDSYTFCWPRDAAYILWPLLRVGYVDEVRQFFAFARDGLHEDGYLFHKYRADGSLGSTWLPYLQPDGSVHAPIQADETAIVLFLVGQYYRQTRDQQLLVSFYESLIAPMANFLAGFTDNEGLPLPSYDPWEHTYLTHTYTTAVTYASLSEAADLAEEYGRADDAARWQQAATDMKASATCLYNPDEHYFYRGFSKNAAGEKQFDSTIDALSLYGAFMFGLFDLDGDIFGAAYKTARERLSDNGGYTRFIGDDYQGDPSRPNLWPIVTLWMAEIALELDDTATADATLDTVLSWASDTGMLPEQVSPEDHAVSSVSPLVWSHAELVSALVDYMQVDRSS